MISFQKSSTPVNLTKQITGRKSELDSREFGFKTMQSSRQGEKSVVLKKFDVKGLTFDRMWLMYLANPWVRACVEKNVIRTSEVTPLVKHIRGKSDKKNKKSNEISEDTKQHIEDVSNFIQRPNDIEESFSTLLKKTIRDIQIYDAGAFELLKNSRLIKGKDSPLIEMYNLPGDTMKLNVNKKGEFIDPTKAYIQLANGRQKVADFAKHEVIYMMAYPQSDRVYGLSPLETLIKTVSADLAAAQYNEDFFANNATPRFAVLMEGVGIGQGDAALARFRTWWDQELKGNPHRPIVIGTESGNVSFEKVSLSNEEMQFEIYSKYLLQKIMAVYHMQPIVLGIVESGMGKLNSAEQTRLYKTDAVKPILSLVANRLNLKVIFEKEMFGYDDVYIDFDLDLVDKAEQAKWHQMYLQSGVLTINEIRIQGMGLASVPWGDVPYLQNNLVPFGLSSDGTSAVPMLPEQALYQAPVETSQVPTALVSRSMVKSYLKQPSSYPVGWENMEYDDRLGILEDMIKMREKYLSKVFMIPKASTIKEKDISDG